MKTWGWVLAAVVGIWWFNRSSTPNVLGTWYFGGVRTAPASIRAAGAGLIFVNEAGLTVGGNFAGGFLTSTSPSWTTKGRVVGGRINWDNGTFWTR